MTRPLSPTALAHQLGLRRTKPGRGTAMTLSWNDLVDLAVDAYWRKRGEQGREQREQRKAS